MEPRYDPAIDTWLDELASTDPDLLDRIEDYLDLLRAEPIAISARRRQFNTVDGGAAWVMTFTYRQRGWTLVWTTDPDGHPVVVAIEQTDAL